MTESPRSSDVLETTSKVLLRCWILGLVLLLISYGGYLFASDTILHLQGKSFELTKHELDLVYCGGLGILKLGVLVLFFIPWLAIQMVPRTR